MTSATRVASLDPAFVDRVMVAISHEPAPTPVRSFLSGVRSSSPLGAARATAAAWHLATQRQWSIGPRARARSMALVLAVLFALASAGTLAAATAVQVAQAIGQIGEQGTVQNGQSGPDQQDEHDGAPAGGVVQPTPEDASTGNQGRDENQNANDRDGGQNSAGQGPNEADGDGSAANQNDGGANEPNQPADAHGVDDDVAGQSGGQSSGADQGANGQNGG